MRSFNEWSPLFLKVVNECRNPPKTKTAKSLRPKTAKNLWLSLRGATTESETNEILAAIEALVVNPPKPQPVVVEEVVADAPVAKEAVAEKFVLKVAEETVVAAAEVEAEVEVEQQVVALVGAQAMAPKAVKKKPAVAAPVVEAPVVEAPVVEAPVVEAPVVEAPVVEAPVAKTPVAAAPAEETPVAKATVNDKKVVEKKEVAIKAKSSDDKKVDEKKDDNETKFADLPLSEAVQAAIVKTGYEKPTPIQAEIIPFMLEGRDVLAQSQTGTGKTAAFALPILSRIDVKNRRPQVLVLAPTRELAIQVARSFETYASEMPKLKVATIYGGQGYEQQFRALRNGAQVVVGTPGRVIDHLKRESLDLKGLTCLVLDEADEMLNMGFHDDVELVLDHTPDSRQIALFSATLPEPIREISKQYLTDPARITIKKKSMTADSIRQRAVIVSPRDKFHVLTRFIEAEETDGVIVFTKTKDATVTVADQLTREGFSAIALNGDMAQNVRERAIQQIKNGRFDILVATDVAARGLDLTRVSHVFNYDLPHDSESYVHRIGRTGRAGRKGEALIFLTGSQKYKLKHIERATRQTIEVVTPPPVDAVNQQRIARFKDKLTTVIAQSDLKMFDKIIGEYQTETGASWESIANALAHMAQGGRRLLLTERTLQSTEGRGREREDSRGSKQGKPGKQRVLGPTEAGMIRYRIGVGWRDGVKPGNIVGCIANEAGLEGKNIGPISIQHSFSTVDLPEGMPPEAFASLKNAWVSGKQLRLRPDGEGGWDDGDSDGQSPRKRYDKNRKPGGGGGRRFSKSSKPGGGARSNSSNSNSSGGSDSGGSSSDSRPSAKSGKGKRANSSNFGKPSYGKSNGAKSKGGKGKFRKAKA